METVISGPLSIYLGTVFFLFKYSNSLKCYCVLKMFLFGDNVLYVKVTRSFVFFI